MVIMSSFEEAIPQDQSQCLMNTITGAKKEMEAKFTTSIDKLEQKMTAS